MKKNILRFRLYAKFVKMIQRRRRRAPAPRGRCSRFAARLGDFKRKNLMKTRDCTKCPARSWTRNCAVCPTRCTKGQRELVQTAKGQQELVQTVRTGPNGKRPARVRRTFLRDRTRYSLRRGAYVSSIINGLAG